MGFNSGFKGLMYFVFCVYVVGTFNKDSKHFMIFARNMGK